METVGGERLTQLPSQCGRSRALPNPRCITRVTEIRTTYAMEYEVALLNDDGFFIGHMAKSSHGGSLRSASIQCSGSFRGLSLQTTYASWSRKPTYSVI